MRILHLLAQRPGRTGSGINLLATLNAGAGRGHRQAVIAGIPASDRDSDFGFPEDTVFNPVLFETDELPFHVAGMSDVMPYQSTRYSDMTPSMIESWKKAFTHAISNTIWDFRPDIILSHHLWLLTTLAVKLRGKIPVIAYAHGTGLRQLKLATGLSEEVITGCENVDLVLAPNGFQKERIEAEYGIGNVIDIGNGYRSELFYRTQRQQSGRIRLIYAGKLSASKGVLQLIDAFETIADESMELLVIGSGSGEEAQAITSRVEISKAPITMIGAVPQEKLAEIFRTGDVFVLPSFYEGMPLVLIEAIACGMRCVCTDLPGVRPWLDPIDPALVEFVPMPDMASVDCPEQDCVPLFVENLEAALRKQIDSAWSRGLIDWRRTDAFIRGKSWVAIFERMEQLMRRLVG